MNTIRRILAGVPPFRWLRCILFAARGVRLHPTATALGDVRLGRGSAVGRRSVLRAVGNASIDAGTRVWMANHVEVDASGRVAIGPGTTIQRRCTVNGNVALGTRCILAPNVFISSGSHPFRDTPWMPIREQEAARRSRGIGLPDRPVVVGDDCWLGANVVVCPGVRLGKGCVVGANAVVTHDVTPYAVVAGAPAREIARRLPWDPPAELDFGDPARLPYLTSQVPWSAEGPGEPGSVRAGFPLEAWLQREAAGRRLAVHGTAIAPARLVVAGREVDVAAGDFEIDAGIAAPEALGVRVCVGFLGGGPVRIRVVRGA